jgi:GH35 family endo-1,4-beta-xylanase
MRRDAPAGVVQTFPEMIPHVSAMYYRRPLALRTRAAWGTRAASTEDNLMKYMKLGSLPFCLSLALPASAQELPTEPVVPELPPLIVEAEVGALGAELTTGTDGAVTFVTVNPSTPLSTAPGNPERVLTYAIQFPAAGEYELYLRFLVGPGGGSDDSLFYASSFGLKDAALDADWITVNALSQAGYTSTDEIVAGALSLPLGAGYRWLNLSEFNGGEAPVRFAVPEGGLLQTFQLGAREDGLALDKIAFVRSEVSQTVPELDLGLPGHVLPPPPPPRACVAYGPPLAQNQSKFLGGAYSAAQSPNFSGYFNQVTPENAGKWGSVEAERDVMNFTGLDEAYAFAKNNGLPFKMHVMVWGNQQPAWIETLPPAEQLEEIREWYAAVAERYPDLDQVEIVNEPLHDPPSTPGSGGGNYIEALGGAGVTGWDWVVNAFRLGREYFPSAQLLINEYSVENSPTDVIRYRDIVALLQAEDLIDGIGVQGHAFSTHASNEVMLASLDALAETGLPIYITELDIDGPTDAVQLADYQRIFTLFWEHPAVMGVTLWGYLPGHWRTAQGAFLAYTGGEERPALSWLRDYLQSPAVTPVLPGQAFQIAAGAQAGDGVGVARAYGSEANDWLIIGGTGAELFDIDAATGLISVAKSATFDASLTPELTLDVVARDECSGTRLTVAVQRPNSAPVVLAGQVLTMSADLTIAGSIVGADPEADPLTFSVLGGSGAGVLAVDPASGRVSVSAPPNFYASSQTLLVAASDGQLQSAPVSVEVTLPSAARLCLLGQTELAPRASVPLLLSLGAQLGACAVDTDTWLGQAQNWVQHLLGRRG